VTSDIHTENAGEKISKLMTKPVEFFISTFLKMDIPCQPQAESMLLFAEALLLFALAQPILGSEDDGVPAGLQLEALVANRSTPVPPADFD
jgi:hypothetical protein